MLCYLSLKKAVKYPFFIYLQLSDIGLVDTLFKCFYMVALFVKV